MTLFPKSIRSTTEIHTYIIMDPNSKKDETAVAGEVVAADDEMDPKPLDQDEQQGDLLDADDVETAPVDLLDDEAGVLDSAPDTSNVPGEEEKEEIEDMNDIGEVDDDGNFKERGADDDDFSTPFQDEGGFDDKEDPELFDDEDDDDEVDDDEVPLAAAVDGKKKKKRQIFTKYKKKRTTEREPSKAEKRRRRRAFCLLICCCLLILLIILLLIFLVFKKDDDPGNDPRVADDDGDDGFVDDFFGFGDGLVPDNVQTTPFDDYVKDDCDFSDNFQPHVLAQCICYGKVSIIADDIRELYTLLKTRLMPELYTEEGTMWDEPITSCDARNQALLWLSSGDTRRSGDLVQRFLTSTAYIAMNGTKWDYQNLWLSEQNECLWLGLQCNKRFQIHSLALDTINIFGTVRICCNSLCLA